MKTLTKIVLDSIKDQQEVEARAWIDRGFNPEELILEYWPRAISTQIINGKATIKAQWKIRPLSPCELIPRLTGEEDDNETA